jgi:hypothetical protein
MTTVLKYSKYSDVFSLTADEMRSWRGWPLRYRSQYFIPHPIFIAELPREDFELEPHVDRLISIIKVCLRLWIEDIFEREPMRKRYAMIELK